MIRDDGMPRVTADCGRPQTGQNFFHQGAPDWSYFVAACGAAAFLDALAFFDAAGLADFLALAFAGAGFFVTFFAMMTSPPRRGPRPQPKVKSPK